MWTIRNDKRFETERCNHKITWGDSDRVCRFTKNHKGMHHDNVNGSDAWWGASSQVVEEVGLRREGN
jgi:hypothetical protein